MTAAPVVSGPRCRCGHVVLLHVMGRARCAAWADRAWCLCGEYAELLAEKPVASILGLLGDEVATDSGQSETGGFL